MYLEKNSKSPIELHCPVPTKADATREPSQFISVGADHWGLSGICCVSWPVPCCHVSVGTVSTLLKFSTLFVSEVVQTAHDEMCDSSAFQMLHQGGWGDWRVTLLSLLLVFLHLPFRDVVPCGSPGWCWPGRAGAVSTHLHGKPPLQQPVFPRTAHPLWFHAGMMHHVVDGCSIRSVLQPYCIVTLH